MLFNSRRVAAEGFRPRSLEFCQVDPQPIKVTAFSVLRGLVDTAYFLEHSLSLFVELGVGSLRSSSNEFGIRATSQTCISFGLSSPRPFWGPESPRAHAEPCPRWRLDRCKRYCGREPRCLSRCELQVSRSPSHRRLPSPMRKKDVGCISALVLCLYGIAWMRLRRVRDSVTIS